MGNKQSKSDNQMVKDIVCGMMKPRIEMKFEVEYKGKRYYFCTQGDKEMFLAHPQRWLEQVEDLNKPEEL